MSDSNTKPAVQKTEDKPVAPVAEEVAAEAFPLQLDEFCQRLSSSDRRVELIAGFHHTETAAGNLTDLEANFAERFEKFCNAPA